MKKNKFKIKPWEKKALHWIILAIAILLFFFLIIPNYSIQENHTVTLPDQTIISVELAETAVEKARGLSYRRELAPDHGLLFLFDEPNIPTFWMHGMNFSIDIIWLQDGEIIDISPNLPLNKELHSPKGAVNQVLEVNAGLAEDHNLKIGDQLEINLVE